MAAMRWVARRCRCRAWLSTLLVGAAALVAWAARAAQIAGVRPEVHLDLDFHGDIGFGMRVDIPIVQEGCWTPLGTTYDQPAPICCSTMAMSGLPFQSRYSEFLINQLWSVFPEMGLALLFGHHHHKNDVAVDFLLAVGAASIVHATPWCSGLAGRLGCSSGSRFKRLPTVGIDAGVRFLLACQVVRRRSS
jgi:hypothetical protein